MKRTHVHLLVDGLLALSGLALMATGLLLAFVLPAHSRGATLWGWTRHDWGGAHFWVALAILGLLLVHLALNWGWVCSVVTKLCGGAGSGKPVQRRRVAVGVTSLAAVVGLVSGFLLAADAAVVQDAGGGRGEGYGWRAGGGGAMHEDRAPGWRRGEGGGGMRWGASGSRSGSGGGGTSGGGGASGGGGRQVERETGGD